MFLRNAAGEKLVSGLDVYCSEFNTVGAIIDTEMGSQRCLVRLREGLLVLVNAAHATIATWAQISKKRSDNAETRVALPELQRTRYLAA